MHEGLVRVIRNMFPVVRFFQLTDSKLSIPLFRRRNIEQFHGAMKAFPVERFFQLTDSYCKPEVYTVQRVGVIWYQNFWLGG